MLGGRRTCAWYWIPQPREGAVLPSPPSDADQRRHRFEAVYAAYHGPVLGYVLRRTGNPDDAADVLADTFLTAWRRLEDLPPEPAARLWLYGVARRVLANHRRGDDLERGFVANREEKVERSLRPTAPGKPGAVGKWGTVSQN